MKTLLIAASFAALTSAHAADATLSATRDYNSDKNGVKLELSAGQLLGVKPVLGVTHFDGAMNRYSVGTSVDLLKVKSLSVAATASGVYQDSNRGSDGFGATLGVKASMPVSKSVTLVAGAERFWGQDRVSASNGTVGSVGLSVKF